MTAGCRSRALFGATGSRFDAVLVRSLRCRRGRLTALADPVAIIVADNEVPDTPLLSWTSTSGARSAQLRGRRLRPSVRGGHVLQVDAVEALLEPAGDLFLEGRHH